MEQPHIKEQGALRQHAKHLVLLCPASGRSLRSNPALEIRLCF